MNGWYFEIVRISLIVCVAWIVCIEASRRVEEEECRIRVFILAGQSNTVGHGICSAVDENGDDKMGTIDRLIQDHPRRFSRLKNGTDWAERSDVWMAYPSKSLHGKLKSCDYGCCPNHMGPEVGFGWAIGDAMDDQVLLIKTAWGGRSLAVDFRPPLSGGQIGHFYTRMIDEVLDTVEDINHLFPQSSSSCNRVVTIEGLAWHQGWDDGHRRATAEEYESNLVNLIRGLRADLHAPDLLVSIGASGMVGYESGADQVLRQTVIDAQLAVGDTEKYPEFAGNVDVVDSRRFKREHSPFSAAYAPNGEFFHWNNNCESYWKVGEAMGNAMVTMLQAKQSSPSLRQKKGDLLSGRVGTKNVEIVRGHN